MGKWTGRIMGWGADWLNWEDWQVSLFYWINGIMWSLSALITALLLGWASGCEIGKGCGG